MSWLIVGAGVVGVLGFFLRYILSGLVGLYRVVPPNEAQVRVLGNSKAIFSHRTGKSAYWVVPFITKINRLPLCNLTIPVSDIKLNDKNMAKFVCDIVCFVNIKDLELASERLLLSHAEDEMGFDFMKLSDDFRAIMESVGRTVVTKQTILDIYMNRSALSTAITHEVEGVFPKWGIELVNLELKHIKDSPDSTIIADIERKVASEIRRDAEIKIAETTKEAEIAKATNAEQYMKRQFEAQQAIGIAEQQKNQNIALAEAAANRQTIEARRTLEVGQAEIEKQKVQQQAEAQKIKFTVEAEGQARQITSVGEAEADVIRLKKEGDAAGTTKLAEALKLFNDAAINVKLIDTQKEILLGKYASLSSAIAHAQIKWVLTGENAQRFFGLNLNGDGGANLAQFMEESGLTLESLKTALVSKRP